MRLQLSGEELRHVKAARCYAVAFCSGDKRANADCWVATQTADNRGKRVRFQYGERIDAVFVSLTIHYELIAKICEIRRNDRGLPVIAVFYIPWGLFVVVLRYKQASKPANQPTNQPAQPGGPPVNLYADSDDNDVVSVVLQRMNRAGFFSLTLHFVIIILIILL